MKTNNKFVSAFMMLPSFLIYPSLVQATRNFEKNLLKKTGNEVLSESLVTDKQLHRAAVAAGSVLEIPFWRVRIPKVHIMDMQFSTLSASQTLNLFQHWINTRSVNQVCFANVHTLITSRQDTELKQICNKALTAIDGQPLVWYANWVLGASIDNRVCGPDLMARCLDEGRERGWKHYFLGGRQQVLQDLVSTVREDYPGVDIVGWHSPPFRELTPAEEAWLIADINAKQPDFLWVGLGAPKQEKWIARHMHQLHAPVQIGVGAAFAFLSGHVDRAPRWMQESGLEWMYRMVKERRLVKRYLQTNPLFMLLFIHDFLVVRWFGRF